MRLDLYLKHTGLVDSREHAKELIKKGAVIVNGKKITKAAYEVDASDKIKLLQTFKWVSRAGYKLEHALKYFSIPVEGKICLDIGSSTGGFTQVLLENGASLVYSVDKGRNLLAPKLREDSRVISLEEFDAFKLKRKHLMKGMPQIVTIDISRASGILLLKRLRKLWLPKTKIILLLKPQFETIGQRRKLSNAEEYIRASLNKLELLKGHYKIKGYTLSPITGKEGQKEVLVYLESIGNSA